jgi:hypothetical protein
MFVKFSIKYIINKSITARNHQKFTIITVSFINLLKLISVKLESKFIIKTLS